MKSYAYWFLCVGLFTAPSLYATQSQDHKKDTQVVDELDRLVDEAGASDFIDNVESRKPSNFELMIRRILGPLVQLYTFTVLEFRKFKSWFLQQWHNREMLYLWAIGRNRNDQEHGA